MSKPTPRQGDVDRRSFLKTSAATAAVSLASVPLVHADGNDTLRVGLIGCGGRGTGAASQALRADRHVRLVAMADAFRDRLEGSLANLQRDNGLAQKIEVPAERRFVGFDAYQQLINSGIDVVLLCTPPGFRPLHIEAAVRAGKHIFAEKPVAVDGPGVVRVLAACEQAKQRKLSIVSGLCWRYHEGMRQVVRRIHDGEIGDITTLQCNYNTGALWHRPRLQGMTDMEWQMRNWYNFTWLSGDFNVEQHVHSLDKMAWVMKNEYPIRCYGTGGRQLRIGPEYGHIFDHMAVVYEFANGVRCFSMCRQQAGCANDVSDTIWGTKGTAELLSRYRIVGRNGQMWSAPRKAVQADMYQTEHNELFASIRSGNPINDGDWMTKSSLMGIMGRMACYTGQVITWDQALKSKEDLSPPRYDWAVPLPLPALARPGITAFS